MDIESPQWDAWEAAFRALAEKARESQAKTAIKGAKQYVCLYGDNGLSEEEEFATLVEMAEKADQLLRVEVDTDYWQDTVLFIP